MQEIQPDFTFLNECKLSTTDGTIDSFTSLLLNVACANHRVRRRRQPLHGFAFVQVDRPASEIVNHSAVAPWCPARLNCLERSVPETDQIGSGWLVPHHESDRTLYRPPMVCFLIASQELKTEAGWG